MKNVILNLYNRDYFTFYLIALSVDILTVAIFKLPLATFLICGIVIVFTLTGILKKFKK